MGSDQKEAAHVDLGRPQRRGCVGPGEDPASAPGLRPSTSRGQPALAASNAVRRRNVPVRRGPYFASGDVGMLQGQDSAREVV